MSWACANSWDHQLHHHRHQFAAPIRFGRGSHAPPSGIFGDAAVNAMAAAFDVDDKPPEQEQAWPPPMNGTAMAEAVSAESESQIVSDAAAAERISSAITTTPANEGNRQALSSGRGGRPPRLAGRALVPDQVFLVWAILALFMMIGLVGLASFYIFLQSNHLYSIPAELARQRNTTRARV